MLKVERSRWRGIFKSNRRVALALGGGGARGLAHIGVLRVLERTGIPIDLIVGTSVGALIGAMYALNPDCDDLHRRFLAFLNSTIYKRLNFGRLLLQNPKNTLLSNVTTSLKERAAMNLAMSRISFASEKQVAHFLGYLLDHKEMNETRIPFAAIASDLYSGNEVILTSGDIIQAVAASSAIPGFLPPVKIGDQMLVDGAVLNPVPILPARKLGADIVIGVDVGQSLEQQKEVQNIIDIIFRSNRMTAQKYNSLLLNQADVILKPAVGHFHWTDFRQLDAISKQGEDEANRFLCDILNVIDTRHYFFRRLMGKRMKCEPIAS
ncbi:patatin-like phospholipase family protein [candidate division KSB1 bacterium]|nr:patatin-like phospholipase family protein [candidate division KSB1 bacterium]